MAADYSPHEDQMYLTVRDELLDAIQTVLKNDKMASRKAHHVRPHLRLKDFSNLKNDADLCNYGPRRIFNIAEALGIKVEIQVTLPQG